MGHRVLIDTHILFWFFYEPRKISAQVVDRFSDLETEVFFSAISIAELRIKHRIGKLYLTDNFDEALAISNLIALPFTAKHAGWLTKLDLHHRDPFDRMLIAQAIEEDMTLITNDRQFEAYPVKLLRN